VPGLPSRIRTCVIQFRKLTVCPLAYEEEMTFTYCPAGFEPTSPG
jgi:hypothetical protein